MRGSFWNVADRSGAQRKTPAVYPEPSAAFQDVTNDVLIVVVDLLWIGFPLWPEGDESGGERLLFEATFIADFVVYFFKPLERLLQSDGFQSAFH